MPGGGRFDSCGNEYGCRITDPAIALKERREWVRDLRVRV
jgi:hypothetical protein